MKNDNSGLGGSYLIDPESGERALMQRTQHDRHADAAAAREAPAETQSLTVEEEQ